MTLPATTVEQPLFGEDFLPAPVPGALPDWRAYQYTGERIKKDFPEKYASIVHEMGIGTPYRQIMRMHGVTYRTCVAIKMAELGTVEKIREHAARGFHELAELARARLAEELSNPNSKIDAKDLAWVADKTAEKAELLTGHATARVENITPIPADADLLAAYADRFAKPVQVEVSPPAFQPALPAPPSDDRNLLPDEIPMTGNENDKTQTPT